MGVPHSNVPAYCWVPCRVPFWYKKNRVIAVVQLINKQEGGGSTEPSAAGSSYDPAAGQHFTAQDEVVVGAFLSLLGPHIFTSSISQFSRKVLVKASFWLCHPFFFTAPLIWAKGARKLLAIFRSWKMFKGPFRIETGFFY